MAKKSARKAERAKETASRRERLMAEQQAAARKEVRKKQVWIGAVAAILILIVGLVMWGVTSNQKVNEAAQPPNMGKDGYGVVMFADKAKADTPVIDVYLDYQCPDCKSFEESFGVLLNELAEEGEIRLVNHTMNFMDGNLGNSASTRAAIAATCSDWAGPEFYPLFNNAIFAKQGEAGAEGYTEALLRQEIPAQVGIEGEELVAFQKCYDEKTPEPFVNKINEGAMKAGIKRTPSLRRNGEPVNVLGDASPEEFKRIMVEGN